jgi:hypothetical protein
MLRSSDKKNNKIDNHSRKQEDKAISICYYDKLRSRIDNMHSYFAPVGRQPTLPARATLHFSKCQLAGFESAN